MYKKLEEFYRNTNILSKEVKDFMINDLKRRQ